MSKATLFGICNVSMATAAVVGAAYVIVSMFLPPPATTWVPTQLRGEPMPPLLSQVTPSQQPFAYAGGNRSQLQPLRVGQVAGTATPLYSPDRSPESPEVDYKLPDMRQYKGDPVIFGRTTPLPSNVPKISQINPALGDF